MNLFKIALLALVLTAQSIQISVASADDTLDEQTRAWLDDRKETGLVLVEKFENGRFEGRPVSGSRAMQYNLTNSGFRITLGFSNGFTDDATPSELRKKLEYVALDRLPMPGLKIPAGWEIYPQTSVSSFRQGVEILDMRDGRITLRVKTNCFAVYGRDTTVRVPADGGAPKGSFFQMRKRFPLDLTINAPIGVKE